MPAASVSVTRPAVLERATRLAPPVAAFLAGAGPVVLLGFSRGGYPVEVIAGYGVALWWLLLVGLLTDAIPRPRPNAAGWVALSALAALAAWGTLSLTWSADPERGLTEVARLVVAGGSLVLGMSAVRAGQARSLAGGVFAGLSVVVTAAVASRLFPDLVPAATQTAEFLASTRRRLAWPLNYWNGVAAAAAIALPLGLVLAARARAAVPAALCVAALPTAALALTFTLSRGGMAAALLGLAAAVVLVEPRPVVVRTLLAPAAATAVVLAAALGSSALTDVTGGPAQHDAGVRVAVIIVLASVGAALIQAAMTTADQARWTPHVRRPTRRTTTALVVAGLLVALGAGLAADGPARLERGMDRFKDTRVTATAEGRGSSERLTSASGNGRYQLWSGALDALRSAPLRGVGLGSWESWWNPRRGSTGFVRNAHSEPFELLAETGAVGGLAFLILLGAPLAAGGFAAFARSRLRRDAAMVVPALLAFSLALLVDWNWQLGALMVAGLTLCAVPLARSDADDPAPARGRPSLARRSAAVIGLTATAVAAIAVLALALVAPQAVNASREAARQGDLEAAATAAARGETAAAFAATPALQRALVAEQAGDLAGAEVSARRAAARTPSDWRPWFLIARVATARGHDAVAIDAFRRARALNPESPLLNRARP